MSEFRLLKILEFMSIMPVFVISLVLFGSIIWFIIILGANLYVSLGSTDCSYKVIIELFKVFR